MSSIYATNAHKRIGKEIAISGEVEGIIKAVQELIDEVSNRIILKVKGSEMLHFMDNERHLSNNPWLIIENYNGNAEELIGKRFITK